MGRVQTEGWCSNRTMVLKQNDDALTERWCSNRTTILKQNDGAQTERWCSNRTMIFKQNDDAQTERWCYNYKNDGVLTERWCSNRTMVLLFPTPPHPTRKREKPAPREVGYFFGSTHARKPVCCGTWPHNTCQLVHLGPNLPTTDLLKTVHVWPDRTINLDRTMVQIECAVTS